MASQRQSVIRFGGKSEESPFLDVVAKTVIRSILVQIIHKFVGRTEQLVILPELQSLTIR